MVPGSQDPARLSAASRGSLPEFRLQGLEIAGLAGPKWQDPVGRPGEGRRPRVWDASGPTAFLRLGLPE